MVKKKKKKFDARHGDVRESTGKVSIIYYATVIYIYTYTRQYINKVLIMSFLSRYGKHESIIIVEIRSNSEFFVLCCFIVREREN